MGVCQLRLDAAVHQGRQSGPAPPATGVSRQSDCFEDVRPEDLECVLVDRGVRPSNAAGLLEALADFLGEAGEVADPRGGGELAVDDEPVDGFLGDAAAPSSVCDERTVGEGEVHGSLGEACSGDYLGHLQVVHGLHAGDGRSRPDMIVPERQSAARNDS